MLQRLTFHYHYFVRLTARLFYIQSWRWQIIITSGEMCRVERIGNWQKKSMASPLWCVLWTSELKCRNDSHLQMLKIKQRGKFYIYDIITALNETNSTKNTSFRKLFSCFALIQIALKVYWLLSELRAFIRVVSMLANTCVFLTNIKLNWTV